MAKRDRRAEIMRAAEKLFSTRRFHEITLDEVVREAGVGKGTVYRYFKDKDDLFFQTAMDGFEDLCDVLEGCRPGDGVFRDELLDACRQISRFFRRRRSLLKMMQGEEWRLKQTRGRLRNEWHQRKRRVVTALGKLLSRGVEAREVRCDVPPEVLASFLLSMLRGRAREPELADQPDSIELTVDLFLEGAAGNGGAE